MIADLAYIFSIFGALALYAVGGFIIWQVIEGAYWLYCKATGRDY